MVGRKEEYGAQQVVDMGLDGNERVLGARLLASPIRAGDSAKRAVLLVLTHRRLLVHQLSRP